MAGRTARIQSKKAGRKGPGAHGRGPTPARDRVDRTRAKQALRESEERFRATFEQAAVGVAHTTTEGRFLQVNNKLCQIVGYTSAELLALTTRDLTHPEDRDGQDVLRLELLSGRRASFAAEKRYRRKDGSEIWVNRTVTLARSPTSGARYLIQVIEDVSERKQTEAAQRESEQQFRETFEQAAVGITRVDLNGVLVDINQKFCDMLGYGKDELLGKHVRDITHPDDYGMGSQYRALLAHRAMKSASGEKRFIRKDGTVLWARRTMSTACDATGKVLYVISVVEDITERKELEQRYRATFDNAPVGIMHTTVDGYRVLRANSKLCEMLGYTQDELLRMTSTDIVHPDYRFSDRSSYMDQMLNGEIQSFASERQFVRKDGSSLWVNRTVSLVRDASGRPQYFIRVIEDISERKQAEEAVARERALLRTVVDALPDHVYVKDLDGRYLLVNETGLRIRGVTTHEEVVGKTAADFAPAEVAKKFTEEDRWVVESGKPLVDREEKAASRGNIGEAGDVKWHLTNKVPLRDAGGKVVGIVGVNRDVTEQKLSARRREMEHSVTRVLSESATVAEAMPRLIRTMCEAMDWSYGAHWLWSDEEQNLVRTEYWSDFTPDFAGEDEEPWLKLRFRHPGGLLRRAWLRKEPTWIVDIDHEESFNRKRAALKFGLHSAFSFPVISGIETIGVMEFFGREVRQPDEMLQQISGSIGRQIGQFIQRKRAEAALRESEEQFKQLAHYDVLTQLPNRALFYDRMKQALAQARRNQWTVGVMFIDLDRFKNVNDTLGHAVGDRLLQQVSERLAGAVRADDTVGRLGGDEFAIVLSNLSSAQDAGLVAQKIMASFDEPFELGGSEIYATASIGITLYPDDGTDQDALIRNADAAMYRAKQAGRNACHFYTSEMNAKALETLGLESSLRRALERKEFLLHYQPKVGLDTGAITGFEALLRWQRGEATVAPAEFIPILEETGLIVPVGEWVLKSVCRQLKQWERDGVAALPVAVNLSARQFQRKNLAATVGEVLQEAGVDPALIELELTESLLMSEAEEAVETLRQLKSLGVRLAVDDFGTGYSSLAYLKRFPLDALKIDRSFIRDAVSDPDDAAIACTIISLAHSLKLKVVAEGVETEGQYCFLKSNGCDEMQGYYFARPMPVEECTRALTEGLRLQNPSAGAAPDAPMLLLVDDDEDELLQLQRALSAGGFRILTARSARAGFELLARHGAHIVVSDHHMPEMSGIEFLTGVRKLYPNTVRVVAANGDDAPTLTRATNRAGIHRFLSKSWAPERLRAEVREALTARPEAPAGGDRLADLGSVAKQGPWEG
ncbi:MAG: PAS domain S-box protein [Betaproteobacteria bacterium]|nr:PAS domain S-box protein [Betaproteobacteria bacterium]